MKKTYSSQDAFRSVIALPPLARHADGSLNIVENKTILNWLDSAGISAFMYGGVANVFHMSSADYVAFLDMAEEIAPDDGLVIPGIGADFGKAMDQIQVLKDRDFPTAVLLPSDTVTSDGVATGIRRLSDAMGKPLMVFFKSADFLAASDLASLIRDGVICTAEYGIGADASGEAPYLSELSDRLGSMDQVIDGLGEISIPATMPYGLAGYTSGSGLIAPHLSMSLLSAVQEGDVDRVSTLSAHFSDFEGKRGAYSPIPVVHDGVRFAGLADTGPMSSFFSSLSETTSIEIVKQSALALHTHNQPYMQ